MDGERKLCEIYGGGNRHKFREFLSGSGRMEDRKIQSRRTGILELGGRRSKILQQEAFGRIYPVCLQSGDRNVGGDTLARKDIR